jgi:hypothetical protein
MAASSELFLPCSSSSSSSSSLRKERKEGRERRRRFSLSGVEILFKPYL